MAKQTIEFIKTLPITDRTKEMVNFVGFNQKLARTLGQINFLIDCRSLGILPKFILNKTAHINKQDSKHRVAIQVFKLQKTILNEEIRDAFRRKAFLHRSLSRSVFSLKKHHEEWIWICNQGRQIFFDELQTVKHRLMKKLNILCEKQGHLGFNSAASKTNKLGENFDVTVQPNERLTDSKTTSTTESACADDGHEIILSSHETDIFDIDSAHHHGKSVASSTGADIFATDFSHHRDDENITASRRGIINTDSLTHRDEKNITLSKTDITCADTADHRDDKDITTLKTDVIAIDSSPRQDENIITSHTTDITAIDSSQHANKNITTSYNANATASDPTQHQDSINFITSSKTNITASGSTYHPDIENTTSSKTNTSMTAVHQETQPSLQKFITWKSKFLGMWYKLCAFFRHMFSLTKICPSNRHTIHLHSNTTQNIGHSRDGTAAQAMIGQLEGRNDTRVFEKVAQATSKRHLTSDGAIIPTTKTIAQSGPRTELREGETAAYMQEITEHTVMRNEPRFVNLSHKPVSKNLATILEKGPKYALTQQVTSSTIHAVEAGIERAFYGLKWQHAFEKMKKRNATSRDEATENDSPPAPEPAGKPEEAPIAMPRPYFPDSGARQPPIIPEEGEQRLENVKSKILSLYRGFRKNEPRNFSHAEMKELKSLKEDKATIIKRSDKCKSLVIMNTSDYISKAEAIVNTYDVTTKNPTVKLEEETKLLMKKTLQNKIPDDYLRKILPQHCRTAEFYGLPKTHKPGNPLRPIVSACGDPLDKLSWFLQCILTQLLSFIPAHLTNTQSYLARLKDKFPNGLPPKSIIFSIDVCNLYGSIPIKEGIDNVMKLIEANISKINTFSTTLDDIRSLLTHVLTNNFVRFNTKIFKQTTGIAMGNRLAPPVAISFMHAFETSFLASVTYLPIFYVRYIDDILGVWTHGIDRLNHFFNLMNSFHPSIRLTIDHTEFTGKLAFLDTLITVHPSGTYTTELYFKPMTAPIILHYTSAHPMSTKRAVLNSEIQRAFRVSSDRATTDRSLGAVTHLFLQNGYPLDIINRTIGNNKYRLNVKSRKPKKNENKNTTKIYMRLPYINETIVRRVNGIIRGSKAPIKPVWINDNSLQKRLVSSALVHPPCPSGNKKCHACENGLRDKCNVKNVVYRISCTTCEQIQRNECYIGECTRPVRYRYNEHLSDARRRKLDTPLGEHILHCHTDISNDQINGMFRIDILDRGRDCAEVKIKESIQIRNLKPSLNTMQSSWPLTR